MFFLAFDCSINLIDIVVKSNCGIMRQEQKEGGINMDFAITSYKEAQSLMELASFAGYLLLKNGAEVYRVEDTLTRICSSRKNIDHVEVLAIYTSVMISFRYEGEMITSLRKTNILDINLEKVALLNAFSRKFVQEDVSVKEGIALLEDIAKREKEFEGLKSNLVAAIGCSLFAIILGGTITDGIISFFIVNVELWILQMVSGWNLKFFVQTILGAVLASVMATTFHSVGWIHNLDAVTIGAVMIFFPGVAITNAVRDLMSGDILSGSTGIVKSLFVALALALGVGLVLRFYTMMGGVIQ